MSRSAFGIRVACALVIASVSAGPAWAQRATGPFAGLFGGDQDSTRVRQGTTQTLDLNGSLFGSYDDVIVPTSNVPAPSDSSIILVPFIQPDQRVQTSGTSAGATGSLSYNRRSDRLRFSLNGGTALREYSSRPDLLASSYNASAAVATNLGPKLAFDVAGDASYSPFYSLAPYLDPGAPFPGLVTPGFGLATISQRNASFDGSVGITDNYSKRSSISLGLTGRDARFLDGASNDVTMWGAHAAFQHRITRAFGFHFGYGRNEIRYAFTNAAPVQSQTIDLGVDYGDTLSFSRRTTLSFGTSTSALRLNGDTHYLLNGSATLTRGFKRSWSASLAYSRGVNFLPGFREPVMSDSVSAGIGGQLASRVKWSAGAGYSRGSIGFSGTSHLATYTGTSRLDFAMTRTLGVYTQYSYYRYQVPAGSTSLGLPSQLSRQSVAVGFSVWVPVLKTRGGSL